MKYYDYIVSLGSSCYTAILLKRMNFQGASNVFDWSGGNLFDKCGIGGFLGKVDLIYNHFDNAFNLEDLETFHREATSHTGIPVRNKRTGLQYVHDFPKNKSIEEEYPHYKQKYMRRVDRLYKTIESARKVLFIFILQGDVLPMEDMKTAEKKMNESFNGKIDFLIFQNIEKGDQEEIEINEHLKLVLFPTVFVGGDGKFNPKFESYLEQEVLTQHKVEHLNKAIHDITDYARRIEKFLTDEELIKCSGYFDSDYYSKTYSLNEENLILHYLNTGYKQNMNPSIKFDGNRYLEMNSDVQRAGINPLIHYLRYGKAERRRTYKVK